MQIARNIKAHVALISLGNIFLSWQSMELCSQQLQAFKLIANQVICLGHNRGKYSMETYNQAKKHSLHIKFLKILFYFIFCLFAFSRAAPAAYGGSQARGLIGAVASGPRQSHSNSGSELHLQPTPQLMATPYP